MVRILEWRSLFGMWEMRRSLFGMWEMGDRFDNEGFGGAIAFWGVEVRSL